MAEAKSADRVLAEDGPPSKRLVLRLTHFEESRLLDLRYWYKDKKTADFRPTSKGVSLTRKNFLCLKQTVEQRSEEILDWLSISYVPEHVAVYEERQVNAGEQLELETPKVEFAAKAAPRDTAFFDVARAGAEAKVTLNTAHPFVERLMEVVNDADAAGVRELVAQLLLCHAQAQESLSDSPATHADVLFDQLVYNWSRLLRRSATRT